MINKIKSHEQIVYGVHAALQCLKNPARTIHKIYCSQNVFEKYAEKIRNFNYVIATPQLLKKKFHSYNHQGIIVKTNFLYNSFSKDGLKQSSKIVILDKIQDPNNIGAILRSAAAFGIDTIIMPNKNCPIFSNAISHVASGAQEELNTIIVCNISQTIKELKKLGFWILAIEANHKSNVVQLTDLNYPKLAIVLGSENKGISNMIKNNCDFFYQIPMLSNNITSLNVSNAAAITFFLLSHKL